MNTLPSDPTANRMMVEVHYYGPWQFCGLTADANWGNMFFYWGSGYHSTTHPSRNATWGEEGYVVAEFQKMKTRFVNTGIPVVLVNMEPSGVFHLQIVHSHSTWLQEHTGTNILPGRRGQMACFHFIGMKDHSGTMVSES